MKNILMVEDDLAFQQIYQQALGDKYKLTGVTTGNQALEKLKKDKSKPDLIILDMMLPGGMNGFDVLERIKESSDLKNIPVIVLTNLDSEEKTSLNIGADDYFIKANTSIDQITQRIKHYLG